MSDINANLNVSADVGQALAQLRQLQQQISEVSVAAGRLNLSQTMTNAGNFNYAVNGIGQFRSEIVKTSGAMATLQKQIDTNKLTMGQMFQNATGAAKGLNVFSNNAAQMTDLATDRAMRLNTQYITLTDSITGMQRVVATRPLSALGMDADIAAQKSQLLNKSIRDLGTSMQNWGKNTQWAGRQLTVGFTVPLMLFGRQAMKVFSDIDKEMLALSRVYGDLDTQSSELDSVKASIRDLAVETTKWGMATKDTIGIAADLAATGLAGEALLKSTQATTRLATLGMMDNETAMQSIISMSTAFKQSSEEVAESVNFLNAVENQTILSIQDMSEAIPRVAPVIQGLGGDVKDLAVFLTAMKEGGVGAVEGANALKTSLARLIEPTKQAREALNGAGIAIDDILSSNRGDLQGLIQDFGKALNGVDEFQQQQVLSATFGKQQFARMGALFSNINRENGQAQKAFALTEKSAQNLAALADSELSKIEESVSVRMTAAVERLNAALAPIGEMFAQVAIPIINAISSILEAFNSLPDLAKWGAFAAVGIIAIAGPIMMLVGQFGNLIGAFTKGIGVMHTFMTGAKYLSGAELDLMAQTRSLDGAIDGLTGSFGAQGGAIEGLIARYRELSLAMSAVAPGAPSMRAAQMRGAVMLASGGHVPGTGDGDTIPALLTPGEFVVRKPVAQKHGSFLNALNAGRVKGFAKGGSTIPTTHGDIVLDVELEDKSLGLITKRINYALSNGLDFTELQTAVTQAVSTGLERGGKLTGKKIDDILRHEMGYGGYNGEGPMTKRGGSWQNSHLADDTTVSAGRYRPINSAASRRLADFIAAGGGGAIDITRLGNLTGRLPGALNQALRGGGDLGGNIVRDMVLQESSEIFNPLRNQLIHYAKVTGMSAEEFMANWRAIDQAQANLEEGVMSWTADIRVAENATEGVDEALNTLIASAIRASGIDEEFIGAVEAGGATGRVNLRDPSKLPPGYSTDSRGGTRTVIDPSGQAVFGHGNTSTLFAGREDVLPYDKASINIEIEKIKGYLIAQYPELQAVGKMTMEQIAEGLRMGSIEIDAVARAEIMQLMGVIASSAGTASPSRITRQIGKWIADGLGIGMRDGMGQVSATGMALGSAATDGVQAGSEAAPGDDVPDAYLAKGQQRLDKIGKAGSWAGMAGMGLGMAGMAASSMGQTGLGAGLMAASMPMDMIGMIAMLGPRLGTFGAAVAAAAVPIVAITAVAAGAAAAVYIWRKSVDDSAKAAADLGSKLGGAANAAKTMADITGRASILQQKGSLQYTEAEKPNIGEYESMLTNEAGTKFIEDLKAAGPGMGAMLSDYVKTAVSQGMMDSDFASGFIKAVGQELDAPMMAASVGKELAAFTKEFSTKTEQAVSIAEKRSGAIAADKDIQAGTQEGATTRQASMVVGSSMQAIQDWSAAAEVARQDYLDGITSYETYISVLNDATQAQMDHTAAIRFAMMNGDAGAMEQALKDQFEKMFGEGTFDAMKDAAGVNEASQKEAIRRHQALSDGPNSPARKPDPEALDQKSVDDIFISAVTASINNPAAMEEIAQATRAILTGSVEGVKEAYLASIKSGKGNDAAFQGALAASNYAAMPQDQRVPGVSSEQYGMAHAGAMTAGIDSTTLTAFLNGLSPEMKKYYLDNLAGVAKGPDANKGWMDKVTRGAAMQDTVGADVARPVIESPDWEIAVANGQNERVTKVEEAMKKLDDFFQDNEEAKSAYVDLALNDPDGLMDALPEITANLEKFDKEIPEEIQMKLGIDLANPDTYKMLTEDPNAANNIRLVGEALLSLPEGEHEFAAMFAVKSNGEFKNPQEFVNDYREVQGLMDKMGKSKNMTTKKSYIAEIMTRQNGVEADPAAIDATVKNLEKKWGKQTIANLPPDVFYKAVKADYDGSQLLAEADSLQAARDALAKIPGLEGMLANMDEQIAALRTAGNQLKGDANDIVASAAFTPATPSGSSGGGGGGGGGGGKPFNFIKELNKDLKDNIKLFGSTVEHTINYKKKTQGLVDALREKKVVDEALIQAALESEDPIKALNQLLKLDAKEAKKFNKDWLKNKALMSENVVKTGIQESKQRIKDIENMRRNGVASWVMQAIMSDEDLLAMYRGGGARGRRRARMAARSRQAQEVQEEWDMMSPLQQQQKSNEAAIQIYEKMSSEIRYSQEKYLESLGMSKAAANRKMETRNTQLGVYEAEIALINHAIKQIDKKKEAINDTIRAKEKENEADRRSIEELNRQDEIRMREAEALNHDLEALALREDAINKAYEDRIAALDKVATINQRIADAMGRQLGLADALSKGDIAAAAAAQNEMNAAAAENAAEDARSGLEKGKENALAGLTLPNGMTREQAEARIRELEEMSYQTKLKIRDIEDSIYLRNEEIYKLKQEILPIDAEIEAKQREIRDIELNKMWALQQQNLEAQLAFAQTEAQISLDTEAHDIKVAELTAENNIIGLRVAQTEAMRNWTHSMAGQAERYLAALKEASTLTLPSVGTGNGHAMGGLIPGSGNKDTYPAMLMPGEFVMRKSIVEKMGAGFFEMLNSGQVPTFSTGFAKGSLNNGATPLTTNEGSVYNEFNINVTANNANASADDIATVVMNKINQISSQNIRSKNGY